MKVLKKISLFCFSLFLASMLFGAEFQIRLLPSIGIQQEYENTVILGGTISLDLNAITVRQRDDIYFSLQGTPQLFMAQGIDPFLIYDVNAAAGYNYKINDRFSVGLEGLGGIWIFPAQKKLNLKIILLKNMNSLI